MFQEGVIVMIYSKKYVFEIYQSGKEHMKIRAKVLHKTFKNVKLLGLCSSRNQSPNAGIFITFQTI